MMGRPELIAALDRLLTETDAAGSPDECSRHLLAYKELGFSEVRPRITGWDQFGQLEWVMREVLPRVLG